MEIKIFDPYQLLTELSSCQSTGCLKASSGSATWTIYLSKGEFLYVDCSIQTLTQMNYFLCKNGLELAFASLKKMPSLASSDTKTSVDTVDQGLIQKSIDWLKQQQLLDPIQTRQLVESTAQDALESFLWLKNAKATWENDTSVPSWVTPMLGGQPLLDLVTTIKALQQRMQNWQQCGASLWSPHQRPYLLDFRDIDKPVKNGKIAPNALTKLAQLMTRGFSLRQLSVLLKQDELHVAQLLEPYVDQGVIFLRNPQPPFEYLPRIPALPRQPEVAVVPEVKPQSYKIVCIDDSPIILSEMERFFENTRYEVTTVEDPVQASAIIFRLKPDLILLDITMPTINGYRLCSLLRSSAMFDETPIIMVTGNTGLIDKARAKLAGATDYFTKPFTQKSLLAIVDKHLPHAQAA